MANNVQSFKSAVENSSKILLILPYILNTDVCSSLGLTYKLLKEKFHKDVDIAASRNIPFKYQEILKACGIDSNRITTEIKPVSYVIRVNDTKDRVDVAWQKSGDRIELVLTPDSNEIDFNKVSFSKEGGTYDLAITFNALRLEDLGEIYTDYSRLYSRFEIVAFNYQSEDASYAKISVSDKDYSSISELLYKIYDDLGFSLDKAEAEIVAKGIIGSTHGLHEVHKGKTFKTIADLANKYQIDISEVIKKSFYSLSKEGIKLRERLLRNIRFDDASKTVYSVLTGQDFSEIGLNHNGLEGLYYLPFNVCDGYDIAFLAYEESFGQSKILLQSNKQNKDLRPVLEKLNGIGYKTYGVVTIDDDANNAAAKTLNAIWGKTVENSKAQTPSFKEEEVVENAYVPSPQETPVEPEKVIEVQDVVKEQRAENKEQRTKNEEQLSVENSKAQIPSTEDEPEIQEEQVPAAVSNVPVASPQMPVQPQQSQPQAQTPAATTTPPSQSAPVESPFQRAESVDDVIDNTGTSSAKVMRSVSDKPFDPALE